MTPTAIAALHAALSAVCPIHGVSIGDPADIGTWRIDFRVEATLAEQTEAVEVLAAFDPSAVPVTVIHIAWLKAALAEAGSLAAVDAAVAAAGPVKAAMWDYATTIRIDHPDVVGIAAALGLDLPALFARAAALQSSLG